MCRTLLESLRGWRSILAVTIKIKKGQEAATRWRTYSRLQMTCKSDGAWWNTTRLLRSHPTSAEQKENKSRTGLHGSFSTKMYKKAYDFNRFLKIYKGRQVFWQRNWLQTSQNGGVWGMFSMKQPITVINQLTQIGEICALSRLKSCPNKTQQILRTASGHFSKRVKVAASASITGIEKQYKKYKQQILSTLNSMHYMCAL